MPAGRDITRQYLQRLRKQLALERQLTRPLAREIRERMRNAAENLKRYGPQGVDLALVDHEVALLDLLQAHYRKAGEIFGRLVLDLVKGVGTWEKKDFAEDEFELHLTNFIDEFATENIVRNISSTTRNTIQHIIDTGVDQGWTVDEIARMMRGMSQRLPPIRAHTIARTETHNAAGFASDKAAEVSGLTMQKRWATAGDQRVRDAHIAMDNEVVPMDESFYFTMDVKEPYALAYPGDRSGPAAGVVNCRCFVLYEPVE